MATVRSAGKSRGGVVAALEQHIAPCWDLSACRALYGSVNRVNRVNRGTRAKAL
jgi:hypothetical protein